MDYDWDFAGGEAEFKKALMLDPNDATALPDKAIKTVSNAILSRSRTRPPTTGIEISSRKAINLLNPCRIAGSIPRC
jgi:hypothetical protein